MDADRGVPGGGVLLRPAAPSNAYSPLAAGPPNNVRHRVSRAVPDRGWALHRLSLALHGTTNPRDRRDERRRKSARPRGGPSLPGGTRGVPCYGRSAARKRARLSLQSIFTNGHTSWRWYETIPGSEEQVRLLRSVMSRTVQSAARASRVRAGCFAGQHSSRADLTRKERAPSSSG